MEAKEWDARWKEAVLIFSANTACRISRKIRLDI